MNGVTLLSKIPVPSLEHTVLRFLFRGHAWNADGISYAGMTYSTGLPNFLGRLLHSPISRTYFAAFGCVSFIYCSYLGNVHTFSRGHIIWRYDAHECFSSELHRSRDGTVLLAYSCFGRLGGKSRFCHEQYTMLLLYLQPVFNFAMCNQPNISD